MFSLLILAARNLIRNLRRSAITLAAIAVGLAMMVATINLANGSYQDMIRTAVSSMAGHVVVQAKGWQEDREDTQVIEGSAALSATLAKAWPDAVLSRRLLLQGLLVSPTTSTGVGLQGLEPKPEAKISMFAERLVEGEWIGDDSHGIVIGAAMAKQLQVGIGDKLVYMGQHGTPDVTSRLFRVKGIFRTGAPDIDAFVAVVPFVGAQALLPFDDPAHQITVHLRDAGRAQALAAEGAALLGRDDLDVLWYRDAIPEVYAYIQVDKESTNGMMFILAVIVAMGVLNTVLMSVMERVREFGVMMAVGMKPRRIAVMVLLEGLLLGVVGGLIGVLLGALLTWPMLVWGIDFSAYMGEATEVAGIAISTKWYAQWDYARVLQYSLACLSFTVLASAYPAWFVTQLTPVQALRHQ